MAKYRKKPIVVDAVQFDPYGVHRMELPEGVRGVAGFSADNWAYEGCVFWVTPKQGQPIEIKAGDWVIREMDSTGYYPCDPEMFPATYEPADD